MEVVETVRSDEVISMYEEAFGDRYERVEVGQRIVVARPE